MSAPDQSANVIAFGGNTMVYESVKRFSLKGLNELMRLLMENIDDALFELAKKVDNDRERTLYFEAMRDIRLKRKDFKARFDGALKQNFDDLITRTPGVKKEDAELELSLVEQAVIEDSIAIENMIAKARPHFEDDLYAVIERLKVILHRKGIKEDANPLDPKAICDSFHDASSILDIDIQAKLIFYKMFDQYVMDRLGDFYRQLNDYFIAKGVLPEFKASEERLKQTTRFMAERSQRSPQSDSHADLSPDGSMPVGAAANPAVGGDNVLSLLRQALSPATDNTVPVAGDAAHSAGGHLPASAGFTDTAAVTGSGANIASGLVTSLTNLQSTPILAQPVMAVDPGNLKTELRQQIQVFKQQHVEAGSQSDKQIIDVVSMLFDFFFDDDALPDPIKVLIGRLQIPILKVAILDERFFHSRKHPARRLLDSISRAALGWSADVSAEKLLIDKIETIVERLLADFEEDMAVFEQAMLDFQQFLDEENDKVARTLQQSLDQEQEQEQRIARAGMLSEKLLQKLETRSDFSLGVLDFLHGIWKSVIFHTLTTQGEDSSHWKSMKKITSLLIWTLVPKDNEADKLKLLKSLPPLLRALSKSMTLVKISQDEQNEVFHMLVLEHARVVKQTSKNIVTRVDDETVWPEENIEAAFPGNNEADEEMDAIDFTTDAAPGDPADSLQDEGVGSDMYNEVSGADTVEVIHNLQEFTEGIINGDIFIDEEIVMDGVEQVVFDRQPVVAADDYLDKAQALEIGSWVEFKDEGSSQNAKLSWKSNVTGKYVFVNRQGHKVRNMTVYGFATMLRAGRARLIEHASVFDRAIDSFRSAFQ